MRSLPTADSAESVERRDLLRHQDVRAVSHESIAKRRERRDGGLRRRLPASAVIANASASVTSGMAEIESSSDRPSGAMGVADAPADGRSRSGRSPNRSSCTKPDMFSKSQRAGGKVSPASTGGNSCVAAASPLPPLALTDFDLRVLRHEFLGIDRDSHSHPAYTRSSRQKGLGRHSQCSRCRRLCLYEADRSMRGVGLSVAFARSSVRGTFAKRHTRARNGPRW